MKLVNMKDYPLPEKIAKTPYRIFSIKKIGPITIITPGEADEDSDIIVYKN